MPRRYSPRAASSRPRDAALDLLHKDPRAPDEALDHPDLPFGGPGRLRRSDDIRRHVRLRLAGREMRFARPRLSRFPFRTGSNSAPIFTLSSFHSRMPDTPCRLPRRIVSRIGARVPSRDRPMSFGHLGRRRVGRRGKRLLSGFRQSRRGRRKDLYLRRIRHLDDGRRRWSPGLDLAGDRYRLIARRHPHHPCHLQRQRHRRHPTDRPLRLLLRRLRSGCPGLHQRRCKP